MQKLRTYFPAWRINFHHLLIKLAVWTRLLSQVIWRVDELAVHHSSWKVNELWAWIVSRRVVSMTSEHHQHVVVYFCFRQCTAAGYIQSIPSFLTCYGRSNMNAYIPSMTCNSRFSWTALLFSSIHSYMKLLHHQMFTCMFAANEGSLQFFST